MNSSTTARPRRPHRRAPGWVPSQHGAWAMLASPLAIGVIIGRPSWTQLALVPFWFVGYFAFNAVAVWLKSRRLPRNFPPVRAYVVLAALLGVVVVIAQPDLIRWAPAFAVPLGVGLWAAANRHERDLLAGVTTVLGSCLMTMVAFDAGASTPTGPQWRAAWWLTAVQFAYFGGTVCYVKSIIRERGNPRFLALSVGWHALCAAAMLWLSGWLAALFGLLTLRAWLVPRWAPTPKQVGLGEIAATVAVAAISLWVIWW